MDGSPTRPFSSLAQRHIAELINRLHRQSYIANLLSAIIKVHSREQPTADHNIRSLDVVFFNATTGYNIISIVNKFNFLT